MDYLDPKKQLRYNILLWLGYIFIGLGIVIATILLIYQAYGFGLKDGQVIQNGLIFFSSQPHPATITLNGKPYSSKTNTRAFLQSGIYHVTISAPGYRIWQRTIELAGGSEMHFDYPLLFPVQLNTSALHSYNSAPPLATQSLDKRWLLINIPGSINNFDVFDMKNPAKAPAQINLPVNLLSKATANEGWQFVGWADDNQHVLLQHLYDGKSEYILLDRVNPSQSLNLNQTLSANPTKLSLIDRKYDQYYLYDGAAALLQSASLKSPAPVTVMQHVLAYQSYSNDTLLYVTNDGAPAGKVLLKLSIGDQHYNLHTFSANTSYLVDLTQYSGTLYVAAGAASENKVYIYQDPVGQLTGSYKSLVPAQVFHIAQPNYLGFSDNAQFIVVEHGEQFGVYDVQNSNGYLYTKSMPLDDPQTHANWMDGDRMTYVSGGKLVVFDYDGTNSQTLTAALPQYVPFFAPDYSVLYNLAPSADTAHPGAVDLDQTPLVIK